MISTDMHTRHIFSLLSTHLPPNFQIDSNAYSPRPTDLAKTVTPQTGSSTTTKARPPPDASLRRAQEEVVPATAPKQPAADATTAQSRFLAAMAAAKKPGATPLLWGDGRAGLLRSD
jgi:hypothetical protein